MIMTDHQQRHCQQGRSDAHDVRAYLYDSLIAEQWAKMGMGSRKFSMVG